MLRSWMVTGLVVLTFSASGCSVLEGEKASTSERLPATTGTTSAPVSPSPTETESESTAPSPSEPVADPVRETYGVDGVVVQKPADAALLTGATDEFKDFIVGLAADANKAGESCPDAFHGITVFKIHDLYASGAVNDCGGYVAIWSAMDGAWREILGTQDAWECDELDKYDVPHSLVEDCY